MNAADVTGPCAAVQYGLIMLMSGSWNSDITENQLDGMLNYRLFHYWKTETVKRFFTDR